MRWDGRYYAILSWAYPQVSREELRALLDLESTSYQLEALYDGLAIFRAAGLRPARLASRAAYTREVGVLLGLAEAEPGSIASLLDAVGERLAALSRGGPVRVEVARLKGYAESRLDSKGALVEAVRALERLGVPASPRGKAVLRVYVTEGLVAVGFRLASQDLRGFHERRPGRRPFFKPGPLDPQLSRAFVNISRLREGDVYFDPFCGTGGFALEACLVGASRCVCGDIDPAMVRGSRVNLEYYGCINSASIMSDALWAPLPDESVDAIATDPPYGRSTTLARRGRLEVYRGFLAEAFRVLRPGRWLSFAGPAEIDPAGLAEEAGFSVEGYAEMYVHSSLTRAIVAARKPGGPG